MYTSASRAKLMGEIAPPEVRPATALSTRGQWRLYSLALLISDVFMISVALRLAYGVRFELALPVFQIDVTPSTFLYSLLHAVLLIAWVLIFTMVGLYHRRNLLGGIQEYDKVMHATTMGMIIMVILGFLEPEFYFARGWLLLAWIFASVGVFVGRFLLRRVVYYSRRRGYFLSPALIVGANEEARLLAQQLSSWHTSGLHVLGFVDNELRSDNPIQNHLAVLGSLNDLQQLVKKHQVEELIVASSAVSSAEITTIFTQYGLLDGLNLRLSSGLYEVITTGLEVKEIGFVPLVGVNKLRLTGLNRGLKLILDYAITIPGILALLPVLGLIALAIKLDSPGPVIHRRRVMGLNGQQFDAYKFRTMQVDGDRLLRAHPELQAELARDRKLRNDPRITRLGHFLRKTSLDELPQLFNVLRREMSLVGPRMIAPDEMSMYGQWGMNLLTVSPGITGLWQVSGRSDIPYTERVRLDMYYIRNWTIWLDIQLLLQTIPAVLQKRGAY
jgi:exopolysaccharide biosynthesis polyprenyl glycosylphosphotransferase